MQTFYIGNSVLGDELAIAQLLLSDIMTCLEADVFERAPLVAEAPHRGASWPLWGLQEVPYRGAPKRRPIKRNLVPY